MPSSRSSRRLYKPPVKIEARQRVQELIAAADWRFTKLAAAVYVDAHGCRHHAQEAGSRIMQLVRGVLARGVILATASALHPVDPLEASRMP